MSWKGGSSPMHSNGPTARLRGFARFAFLMAAAAAFGSVASADPVDVSYIVSGVSGDYVLDFSVTNNLSPASQDVYFFGVLLSSTDIVNFPTNYISDGSWNPAVTGGSNTTYNDTWIDGTYSSLFPGNTLSGFEVQISDLTAPTSVQWFAYGVTFTGGLYTGGDNFGSEVNPGFEGVATEAAAVPEPSGFAAIGIAFAGLVAWRRRAC